jgi:Alr-MurF fusion protein
MNQRSLGLQDLANVPGYSYFPSKEDEVVNRLCIDTRALSTGSHTVFFAIKGKHLNGHLFLEDAYKKGIRQFVVEEKPLVNWRDASWLVVPNTVEAIQRMARMKREQFSTPVWAITGSNGKTIVKEWLAQALADELMMHRSPRSYNSQLGVPLSVWDLNEQDEIALFEAGISQPGEMEKLQTIIQPDVGLFTHLGEAHLENFDSRLHIAKEKCKLFISCKKVLFCADEALIHEALDYVGYTGERITWSMHPDNEASTLRVKELSYESKSTRAVLLHQGRSFEVRWPFTDGASTTNALLVILALLEQGLATEKISQVMETLHAVDMRMQLVEGEGDTRIVNDVYNSDPGSFRIALNYLNSIKGVSQKVLIMSDILQSGVKEAQLYQEINDLINEKEVDLLITVGKDTYAQRNLFSVAHRAYHTTEELLEALSPDEWTHSAILVKGARPFHLERVVELLQQSAHETVLEINLGHLIHNLNFFNNKLQAQTRMMVMVKAFGYGSGGPEIAAALEYQRVSYLGVAYVDEGVELRKAGIGLPIMVMNPDQKSFGALIRYRLEPEVYSLKQVDELLEKLKTTELKRPYPIHLKLETGMYRLGFGDHELDALIGRLLAHTEVVRVVSVFSHLAAADDPSADAFTRKQIDRFKVMSEKLRVALPNEFFRHLANTAGILRFPESHFDMVRLGIGLYGASPDEAEQAALNTVGTLRTRISQIKEVAAGEPVGYGRSDVADHPRRVAIVPVGYADGLDRRLSNGKGYMTVGTFPASIVGRVCMDMTMLDVTGSDAEEGDRVVVFGDKPTLFELAELLDTIPYEILTSIPERVKRVYIRE